MYGACSYAHHPHDPVDALVVSPSYNEDNTIYIAYSNDLFKSVNGGHSWKEVVNGLDNKYPISSINIAPSEIGTHTIFISTLGNGVYRSMNGGTSWKNVSNGLRNLAIREISARSNKIVLANGTKGQLYFTNDSGKSWRTATTLPQDAVITAVSPPMQFPETSILAGDSLGRVLVSTNNGGNWEAIGQLPTKTEITVIAIDPSDASRTTFFVGTQDKGLYKSSDNGKSFQPLDNGLSTHHILSLAFSPKFAQDRTMIATSWREAAFISSDGGDTWMKFSKGLTTDKQADSVEYQSPHFRQIKITGNDSQTMFLAAFTGLYKSTNGGHSWSEMETRPVNLIRGIAVSPASKDTFRIAISTYGGGAYISHDNGATWIIANKGLENTRLMGINFTPSYPLDHTLFSASKGYLLKLTDSKMAWEKIPLSYESLRNRIGYKLIRLGVSKNIVEKLGLTPDTRQVYPTVITPSPDYATDKTVLFGTRWHGMYRSENGGHTSYNIWDAAEGAVTSLALSPSFSKDHTAFIYIRGDGIYKSTDKGDSWHRLVQGLPFNMTNPATNNHIKHGDFTIVFSPGYSKDQTLFSGGGLGLFKSTDKGENWSELKDTPLEPASNILAVGLSPNYVNDHTLLISLKGHGLYKSVDGGQTFFKTGKTLIKNNYSIELIAFSSDFSQNDTIYVASDENLFQSSDRGSNWTLIQRPVRYEDRRNVILYEGNWVQAESSQYSASTVSYSETKGNRATLAFVGCGIRWIASKSPEGGTANVYIDNSIVDSVDLHSEQLETMSNVFSRTGLLCSPHTITIEVSEGETGNLSAGQVVIDAFDVLPAKLNDYGLKVHRLPPG
jgi:photosystem II stability/assembly factor-like uncharacterized protein